jgi:4-amino-4-deoxy-L-arabinose transferase-like glycosyltransferase
VTRPWMALAGLACLALLVGMAAPNPVLRFAGAFVFLVALPGYLLAGWLAEGNQGDHGGLSQGNRGGLPLLERWTLGLAIGYALLIGGGLVLHYVPGPLTPQLVYGSYGLLLAGLLIWRARRGEDDGVTEHSVTLSPRHLVTFSVIVVVAGFFRLANLGYSDFIEDETSVMLRAEGVIQGTTDVVFRHHKGPGEVLVPALFYAAVGHADEGLARLPFALASIATVVAIYVLGRRLFNPRVALAAGLIAAINGTLVAFARQVQYQSLVTLLTVMAVFCLLRLPERSGKTHGGVPLRHAVLGMALWAAALLAHYEVILVLPVLIYLLWPWLWQERRKLAVWASVAAPVVAVGLGFFVPFILHPSFKDTLAYLTGKRIGSSILYNNLDYLFTTGAVYNSTAYILGFCLLLAVAVVIGLRQVETRVNVRTTNLVTAVLGAGAMTAVAFPGWWRLGALNLSVVPFAGLGLLLAVGYGLSRELKGCFLWLIPAFLVFMFAMDGPGTHYYLIFPAWALLGGMAIQKAVDSSQKSVVSNQMSVYWLLSAAFWLGLVALYVYCAGYIYVAFVRSTPEFLRDYPASRVALYWVPYGDTLPAVGPWFGFPYRAGWEVIGSLYQSGQLAGDYDTNEQLTVANWYTGGTLQCEYHPRYYFALDQPVQDNRPIQPNLEADYQLTGVVMVNSQPRIRIYEHKSDILPRTVTVYRSSDYEGRYGGPGIHPPFGVDLPFRPPAPISHPLNANLDGQARLVGFDLDRFRVPPGGVLTLTLYWQAIQPIDHSYVVFTHVETDRIWGQGDGIPNCGKQPTNTWQPGRTVIDRISIPLNPQTPPGSYPLVVGLYDFESGQRLDVLDAAGSPQGNQVELARVEVLP